jgi:hypothetical protein
MFERRSLPDDLEDVRTTHARESLVLDVDADFDTIPSAAAEDLGLLVDSLDPATYPVEWIPEDSVEALHRYASTDFTVGMPGDGTVTWTRQTNPPVVLVKSRASGTPEEFRDFLIGEALVQVGLGVPEHFLPFFEAQYVALDEAVPLGPASVYQMAAALYEGWVGRQTRSVFAEWVDSHPRLYHAWEDAGQRLVGRLDGLPGAVARGDTTFPEATEFACSAIKHGLDLPAPFAALDTSAYVEYGPVYAVQWAEKTFERLRERS